MKQEKINKTYYPTCRFCGATSLPLAEYPSQTEADEAATIRCNCVEARQYQHELEAKQERLKNIDRLNQRIDDFSTYCENRGVKLQDDGLRNLILNTGIAVLDGVIAAGTITFGRMKVKVSMNSKGVIIIGFTYTDGASLEV